MGYSKEYRGLVEERLSSACPIRTRPMFGGLGIYSEDLFFALVDEDRLYLKVSELNQADFEREGMEPFVPWPGAQPMGYWELPKSVFENDAELKVWVDKALAVAEAAKKAKPKR
jgi:DNA transformation protein